MGRSIYFTDSEIDALRATSSEWCDMMNEGEDTVNDAEERLENGLGSALKKLHKGTNGERIYKDY